MVVRLYVDFNTMTTDPKERVYINTQLQPALAQDLRPGLVVTLYDEEMEVDALVEFDEQDQVWLGQPHWSTRRDVVDTTAEARVAREAWAWTQPVFLNCPGATVQGYRPRLYWCGVETRANFVGGRGYAPAAPVVEWARGRHARGPGG